MTHELKNIFEHVIINQNANKKSVLATVVALKGSSYRKPGVRMLISEDCKITGAVSGGCVEKAIAVEAKSVLKSGKARMMTYDGRYRLGCEGILYILLEIIEISEEFKTLFFKQVEDRKSFVITSIFSKEDGESEGLMSILDFGKDLLFSMKSIPFKAKEMENLNTFEQALQPITKLILFGAEHDAVKLCVAAALLGWDVIVIVSPKDPKTKYNFPGSKEVLAINIEAACKLKIDSQTAVIIMTHNYARDLHFLHSIKEKKPFYIGLLGATLRREKLYNEFLETETDIEIDFFERLYGPAGIDIGAITPEEISISILSEILAVKRGKKIPSLREQMGNIH